MNKLLPFTNTSTFSALEIFVGADSIGQSEKRRKLFKPLDLKVDFIGLQQGFQFPPFGWIGQNGNQQFNVSASFCFFPSKIALDHPKRTEPKPCLQ